MDGFVSQIRKAISIQDLDNQLSKLHKGMYISKGSYSTRGPSTVVDYEWNHLDQGHRNYLHDAYHDAIRVATSNDIAISVTAWKNLPIYIQVADMRIGRGLFYQTFNVFGLIFCFQICRMTQDGDQVRMEIEWRTASSKWLRFLHGPFNKRLHAIQKKQDGEDFVIRDRRARLRALGFRFKTDEPDYINANILTDMVIFPALEGGTLRQSIEGLPKGQRSRVKMGPVELYVTPTDSGIDLWPALCPHEGAIMPEEKFCDGILQCPWHGRRFKATSLAPGSGSYRVANLVITLEGRDLVARLLATEEEPSERRSAAER